MDVKFKIAVLIAVATAFSSCTKENVKPANASAANVHWGMRPVAATDSIGGSGEQNPPVQK